MPVANGLEFRLNANRSLLINSLLCLFISLCLMGENPPLGHDRACSTENFVPQVHVEGTCDGCLLSQSILKGLVQCETKFSNGQHSKPGGSSSFLSKFHRTFQRVREVLLHRICGLFAQITLPLTNIIFGIYLAVVRPTKDCINPIARYIPYA